MMNIDINRKRRAVNYFIQGYLSALMFNKDPVMIGLLGGYLGYALNYEFINKQIKESKLFHLVNNSQKELNTSDSNIQYKKR